MVDSWGQDMAEAVYVWVMSLPEIPAPSLEASEETRTSALAFEGREHFREQDLEPLHYYIYTDYVCYCYYYYCYYCCCADDEAADGSEELVDLLVEAGYRGLWVFPLSAALVPFVVKPKGNQKL